MPRRKSPPRLARDKTKEAEVDLPLWPGKPPEYKKGKGERVQDDPDPRLRRRHVSLVDEPTLSIYPATGAQKSKLAVIVCPGGGYHLLSIDVEGHDVSRWLNHNGITSAVLKYRLHPYPEKTGAWLPLLDVQRAIRTLRARADEYGFDPDYIGVIGFSAGAHLAALAAVSGDAGDPKAKDPIERQGSRPNFTLLIYPLSDRSIESKLSSDTPPAFVVQSNDDHIVDSGIRYFAAARAARARTEFHFFQTGGHGYGLGVDGGQISEWPRLAERWLKEIIEPAPPHHPFVATRKVPKDERFHKRVRCGFEQRWQDPKGYIWEPDYPFAQDGLVVHRGPIAISGTTLPEIYRSERYAMTSLKIPVPNGSYRVRLHFCETYKENQKPGKRVFSVSLNGANVLPDWDPLKAAGGSFCRAVVKELSARIDTGTLELGFESKRDQSTISAIEILG